MRSGSLVVHAVAALAVPKEHPSCESGTSYERRNEKLKRQRDAVMSRDREVGVNSSGVVREVALAPSAGDMEAGEGTESDTGKGNETRPEDVRGRIGKEVSLSRVGAQSRVSNQEVCARFRRALVPNVEFIVHVTDQDRDKRALPLRDFVTRMNTALSELCGGYAPAVNGDGGYGDGTEETAVLSAYLPEAVTDQLRDQLLEVILDFGTEANQEEVLTAIRGVAYRFRFARSGRRRGDRGVVARWRS